MAMSYNTLVAAKGAAGSIANWVGYGKIDIPTVLDEAQSIIFQSLRVREMRTQYVFGVAVGQSNVVLPQRFLDPIGRMIDTRGMEYTNGIESDVVKRRSFQAVSGGTMVSNAFTTNAANSPLVNVVIDNHGLTQGSDVTFPNGPVVDGINLAGTFPVMAIIDADHFIIESTNDQATVGNVTGGGSGVTWSANLLIQSTPQRWSIFDEAIQFDAATNTAFQARLLYYRSPILLSMNSPTNFLTSRFPRLIREATNAAAASFMKDDNEEQKALTKLAALIEATNVESDLMYRGADLYTETPGSTGRDNS